MPKQPKLITVREAMELTKLGRSTIYAGKQGVNMNLEWKVNTAALLKEVLNNKGAATLKIPLVIFGNLLTELAERCAEINDPVLNGLMAQLALYDVTDPYSRQYDPTIAEGLIAEKQRKMQQKAQ